MTYSGVLTKMKTQNGQPVQYFLNFETDFINVNQLLGKHLSLQFLKYECLNCGLDKKIFRQGYCYDCFYDVPQAADWVIKPELSKAHLGQEERDLEYEKKMQLQPHIVYLANSSSVKVGVTRKSQLPTRWIDQGAHEAVAIVEAPNRYLAGITEVALKDQVSDKTNWRSMLKNDIKDEDLMVWRERLLPLVPQEARNYVLERQSEMQLQFPVQQYPEKPKSLNLVKEGAYTGKLVGIKGQYLIFEDQTVFNVRSNEGLYVVLEVRV